MGFIPAHVLDTLKILHKPFGFKVLFFFTERLNSQTSNPVINLDHDDDWILSPEKSLAECGIGESFYFVVYSQSMTLKYRSTTWRRT
jgi:hypothetical protein